MKTYVRINATETPCTNIHESRRTFFTWCKQHMKLDCVTYFRRYIITVRAGVILLGTNPVQPKRGSFCRVQFSNKVPVLLMLISVTLTSRVDDILLVR